MTQKYDKDFKINAVKVYLNNTKSVKEIAEDLGVSRASLGHWIVQYRGSKHKPSIFLRGGMKLLLCNYLLKEISPYN